MKKNIYGLSLEELSSEMVMLGQKPYRGKQLFSWLYVKRATEFGQMTDISAAFRAKLEELYVIKKPSIYTRQDSSDGTIKLLLELEDGYKIETVLMAYNYGDSVCVTSEVGCNMGCAFCASGLLKKKRGLTTAEMVGQVLVVDEILRSLNQDRHVTHVVVMGTGEPFDNYDEVIRFVKIINSQFGISIGARHITVSTCGVIPGILRYGKEGLQVNLAISLHAPTDEIRNQIMPINKAYPLKELIEAILQYGKDSNGRRVTYEYILLSGINDSDDNAHQLADLVAPTFGYINLIPYNEVDENGFKRSSNNRIHRFHDILLKRGIKATIRKEFGSDIDAACGQLRARYEKKN